MLSFNHKSIKKYIQELSLRFMLVLSGCACTVFLSLTGTNLKAWKQLLRKVATNQLHCLQSTKHTAFMPTFFTCMEEDGEFNGFQSDEAANSTSTKKKK